jgi:twitching motility protein PilT
LCPKVLSPKCLLPIESLVMASPLVQYLQALVKQRGSDLHVSTASVPMIRVHGDLIRLNVGPTQPAEIETLINEVTNKTQKAELTTNRQVDFSFKVSGLGVFRANIFLQRHGWSAVFRALTEKAPSLGQLHLPPIIQMGCSYANGLILVTGPTGSGKSTTLAAMVNHINENERGHILTLEDPIEFYHDSKRCMVNQRQLGTHFTSFAAALKASLREDPDVILVGEMRDPETIALAITAAETGHLVFATLHTNSATKSIDRMIDTFPGDQQSQIRSMLSESLRMVISQRLIKTADGQGRLAFHDILVNTPAVANLIREGKAHQLASVMQTGRKNGMIVMDQAILEAAKSGKITPQEAWDNANDKGLFTQFAPREVAGNLTLVQGTQLDPKSKVG